MSATKCSRAWIAAASVGAVEALKDQLGFCRWNYAIRSFHHNAKNNVVRSIGQAKKRLESDCRESDSAAAGAAMTPSGKRWSESEESLRKVMYLSCWGPNN
ncbi:Wound-responsive family protein [Striga hermonthica]|uniref:Wound-responsive family protein n=1 Tax=Striga hermonthica TaxID=68872 RepID=A0A9N7R0D2_STRHE|nr:Wound-responsive family protein [Striga hermonthica]